MLVSTLDHVSLPTVDLERAAAFYKTVLNLHQVTRPAFRSQGMWLASGALELHLSVNPAGHWRPEPRIDFADTHFAVRVNDFDAAISHLKRHGFRDDVPDGDPKRIVYRLNGPASYRQAYILDPDNNQIEINEAPLRSPA